jgi:hypothetical protein
MHAPDTNRTGIDWTAVGSAGQTIPTTKYSVGISVMNRYGDRMAALIVKCDTAYSLAVWGSGLSFASVANTGAASGVELFPAQGFNATSKDGRVHFVPIASGQYILPVLYNPTTGSATVTITMKTYNGDVSTANSQAGTGSLVMPSVAAETVVAGASSVLGKIGTIAAAATIYVRVPCAAASPATARANIRIQCDKAWAATFYHARTILNAPTITLTTPSVDDTVIINGLTFTAKATESLANRQFNQSVDEDTAATSLAACINSATYGVPGVTATAALHVVTLTATTATTTQCVTGVGGAHIVCAQTILASLEKINNAPHVTGGAANNTTAGTGYEVYVDGWPHIYVGVTNSDAANPMTLVVGATLLPV